MAGVHPPRGKKVPRLIRAALERAGVGDPGRLSSGVDVIGDIAVVRLTGFSASEKKEVARALLAELRNVRVVMAQEGGIEGEYRLRKLRHLAGEKRTITLHRENGCVFRVDIARCYFSPRLSTERLRIAKLVKPEERVLNMFAGVGPYSIPIAKLARANVTSCELNDYAARLHVENNELNKVDQLVSVIRGDAMDLPAATKMRFDRVLMPLPSEANRFLHVALAMAKEGGTIHYYRHLLGKNEGEAAEAMSDELSDLLPRRTKYGIRRVRDVGPRWVEMAAEIRAPG
jgi:tRNA (guanine37-N1)-methyltransferase